MCQEENRVSSFTTVKGVNEPKRGRWACEHESEEEAVVTVKEEREKQK